jgi:hypothetical protein
MTRTHRHPELGILPAVWVTTMTETKPKRRWYQFSLRFLLLATVIAAFLANVCVEQISHANRIRRAVAELSKFGATVNYDYEIKKDPTGPGGFWTLINQSPPAPKWIRNIIGDEYFVEIANVVLTGKTGGLEVLDDLPNLMALSLERSDVTDKELVKVKSLSKLTAIWLDDTSISDEGLKNLEGLKHLKIVAAPNTRITENGVKALRKALPNIYIWYGPDGALREGVKNTEMH